MANDLVVYTIIHQPRRIKLPAQPIPRGAVPADIERCLFDERMNERYFRKVGKWCYYPATRTFLELVEEGFKLSIGFSVSFLKQAEMWDQELLGLFQKLVRHENVELIGVEPYHSFIMLVDLERFIQRMHWAGDYLYQLFGKRPVVTDTTEMCMSDSIYHALDKAGFKGAVLDGRPWVMGWRDPTYLYNAGKSLKLLTRDYELSDDVGYRFSNRTWSGWPLSSDTYAHWLREARGDFVFLAWDYETFGEHHSKDTGIFEFLRWMPSEVRRRGMGFLTPSEAIEKYGDRSYELPLSAFPSTWAGSGGMEFFLGNSAQQAVFQLMLHCYNTAVLTGNTELEDLALWLLQSDNLHLIQWFGRGGSEAEVSAYFTPDEWWDLGPGGIIWEQQQVYRNFLGSLDPYL
ncbi:MAG TPA: glycoside hydrolase family 57 protein [Chloroflexota bacterium]|nr:glycoside hydrolase family 57 protein [Chloroflexota bacterium]